MNGKSTCFFLHRDKMAGENLGRKNGAPAAKKFAESSPGALNPKGNVSSVGFNGTSTVIRKSVSADRACTGRVPEREFRWYRGHFRPKQKKFCLGLFVLSYFCGESKGNLQDRERQLSFLKREYIFTLVRCPEGCYTSK